MSQKTHVRVSSVRFLVRFVANRYILQLKCLQEGINRNLPARNTLVQLLAVYTDPESYNTQRYRQTDRPTDGQHDYKLAKEHRECEC